MTRLHRIAQFLLKPITRNGVFFFMMYALGIVTALIAPSSDRVDFNSDHFLYDNLFRPTRYVCGCAACSM